MISNFEKYANTFLSKDPKPQNFMLIPNSLILAQKSVPTNAFFRQTRLKIKKLPKISVPDT
jgi:hypothetical protein